MVREYDPGLEKAFFSRVILANGAFKSTTARRMDDLNEAALPVISAMRDRPIEILDVAASSGISSQEWYLQLTGAGLQVSVTGTDLSLNAVLHRGTVAEYLFDPELNLIYLSLFGSAVHPRVLKALRSLGFGSIARRRFKNDSRAIQLRLMSKGVSDVTMVEEDLERPTYNAEKKYHVIRAANILNLGYFPATRLLGMVSKLLKRITPGGVLIVCRTHADGSNHASIFRFDGSGLSVVSRLGSGSEIEQIALQAVPN